MSCITEILKLKGDQDALLVNDKNDNVWLAVEGGGVYQDYEYLITFTDGGHRCGYVAVPPGHPINNVPSKINSITGEAYLDYDAPNIDCHGGVTFLARDHGLKSILLKNPCNDLWIGFDCAHCWDGKDLKLIEKYYGQDASQLKFYRQYPQYAVSRSDEVIKSYEYVESECKKIIEQLREAA